MVDVASLRLRTDLIDFTIERQRHRRFVGRDDVLAQLDEWLIGPGEAGWVVVTGGPGMGKSAIMSSWLQQREAAGAVIPHHFVRRQVVDWDQPERIAASLAAQIEGLFPELRDPEAKPEGRLIELLGRVSKRLGRSGDLVLMVDGLDETRAEPGDNPLPRFLPHEVPVGIRLLCATRPTYPHMSWIEARSARWIDLDARTWAASNEAVVRGFWEAVTTVYKPPLTAEERTAAIARAEGNVLHAVMLHDALRGLPAHERHPERIPRGLKALLGDVWSRAASDESVRVGLGLLCVAQEALSLDVLTDLAGWGYDERERFVPSARELLLEEPTSWAGVEAYRPRHNWVREFMIERLGSATIRAHHGMMAHKLATWPAVESTTRRYSLRHALAHRAEAGDWAGAWRLAAQMSFVEAKCRELGVHETELDMVRAAERCGVNGDETLRRNFDDLARALRRESHWLREAPDATAALVWNQLRLSGWSTDQIAQQLQLPAGPKFLRVRHLATRESHALVRDLIGHSHAVVGCAVTPDSRHVVSVSDDNTIKVWDLETGRELVTLAGHGAWVNACVVTPDGQRVVSTSNDNTLKVWDLRTGRELATLVGHVNLVTACAVTPDGRRVVSASADYTLKVWDLETARELATLVGHASWVNVCTLTPDGRRVVSASWDSTLKVWDLETGRELVTLVGHAWGVNACVVTWDSRHVVSASNDHTLKVWDLETGRELATLKGHVAWVNACAVTPDGRRMVSASWDHGLKVWDLETGRVVATLAGHPNWEGSGIRAPDGRVGYGAKVNACAVTPDGRRVVSTSWDHTLKVLDLETGRVLATLVGHSASVNACAVTPDGRRVVSASWDHTLKVWDLESNHTAATMDGHGAKVNACAMTPDGRRMISASHDEMLKVWDIETGRTLATLEGHCNRVNACAVTPDGRRVVSASDDRTLRVWDFETRRTVAILEGHGARVNACAVTRDGRRMVSASWDNTLKVWDLETMRELSTLAGHANCVTACAMTSDDRRLVSASADHTLKVWDIETGRTLATLEGHGAGVNACAVTPDGRCVVSASDDRTLKVWDIETGRAVGTLDGHGARVNTCAVTPDGRHVVSSSEDHTLKVWDLETSTTLLTHRSNTAYSALATTSTVIIAGDSVGSIWFLDWPPTNGGESALRDSQAPDNQRKSLLDNVPSSPRSPIKHTILFLAASPGEGGQLELEREARAIQKELESAGHRDCFEFETRWAVEPLDLLRELRKLKPTVVHFTSSNDQHSRSAPQEGLTPCRNVDRNEQQGLFLWDTNGNAQFVSTEAIAKTFGAAGSSVRVVVLNACYSDVQAKALLAHVDCVLGTSGSIHKDTARTFAIGFYGGLGEREPVAIAYEQGCAAISLQGLPDGDRPQLQVRAGIDASSLVLAADPQ